MPHNTLTTRTGEPMSYLLNHNPGTQQWGFPRRGGAQLSGTIIVHTAECAADNVGEDTSAEGCANMIANRADYGSYHRLVDSDSIIDMLPWEYEAWQDSETNNWAVGISAALRTSDWLTMPADRRERVYRNLAACAAEFVRYMATKGVAVPLTRITGAQARARVPGFCAHGDSGIARSDPGAAFDWAKFFAYTAQALDTTGSINYASESITPLTPLTEDDMYDDAAKALAETTLGKVETMIGMLNNVASGINEVPGKTLAKEVPVANTDAVTSLQGFLSYAQADREATVTRISDAIANTPAPELAAQIDAAGIAADVRDELVKLLGGK